VGDQKASYVGGSLHPSVRLQNHFPWRIPKLQSHRRELERLKKLCSRLQPGFLSSGEALATESMSAATCAGAEMKPELKKTAPFQRRQTATEFV
jgi:hypothetical protein